MAIVLIGNAPIHVSLGKLIDHQDLVVRIGTCILREEYKEQIGSRTDRWVINACLIEWFIDRYFEDNAGHTFDEQVRSLLAGGLSLVQLLWLENLVGDNEAAYPTLVEKAVVPVECIRLSSLDPGIRADKDRISENRGPVTTGINVIAYYISAYKDQRIYICGFGPRGSNIRRSHCDSSDVVWPHDAPGTHDLDMCRELVNLWEEKGFISRLDY